MKPFLLIFLCAFSAHAQFGLRSPGFVSKLNAAAGAPSDPSTISNLQIWLKAESLAGANGTATSPWTDSSGNDYSPTNQGTARPYVTNSVLNGYNALFFATNQWLQFPPSAHGISSNVAGMTVVAVHQRTLTSAFLRILLFVSTGASTTATRSLIGEFNGDLRADGRRLDADSYVGNTNGNAGSSFYASTVLVDYSAADLFLYTNGVASYTNASFSTAGNSQALASQRMRLGADGAGGNAWVGRLAELIVYNRKLTSTELAAVHAYLRAKFGLW